MAPTKPSSKKQAGRATVASKKPPKQSARTARSSDVVKKGKGRPSKNAQASTSSRPSVSQSQISRPKKKSNADPPLQPQPSQSRKRNAPEPDDEEDVIEQSGLYPYLKPRKSRQLKDVMDTWPAPAQQVQEQIQNLLGLAKRSVLLHRRDEEKRRDAETTLGTIIRRLDGRIQSLPCPPKTKDMDFDLERLRRRNNVLEEQLTSTDGSIKLLKASIDKEQLRLDEDRRNLAQLEKNLKDEISFEKRTTKVHPLLQGRDKFTSHDDTAADIGLVASERTGHALEDDPDPDLAPLLAQLRRNLESMRGNHAQVEGIDDAIKEAHVALDDVLFRHASSQQYDAI